MPMLTTLCAVTMPGQVISAQALFSPDSPEAEQLGVCMSAGQVKHERIGVPPAHRPGTLTAVKGASKDTSTG